MKLLNLDLFYFLLSLLFIFSDQAAAQEYSYNHYNTKDGLAGATIYSMAQDQDGFIWFGTEAGLSRFDGTHFKNFTLADGLPNNQIFGLYVDTKNRVWITCFKNAISYYSKGKIHNQQNDTLLEKITLTGDVGCIAENAAGDLIFKTLREVVLLKKTGKVVLIPLANMYTPTSPIAFDPIGGIGSLPKRFIAVPDYVYQQIDSTSDIALQPHSPQFKGRIRQYICNTVNLAGKNRLLFFSEGNPRARLIDLIPHPRHIRPINQHTYAFVRNYNGVTLYNINNNKLTCDYFTRYTVHFVIEDEEKNLWFGTKGLGVFKISNGRFKNYSFNDLGVYNIQKIRNRIYIGTDNSNYWSMPSLNADDFNQDAGGQPVKIQGRLKDLSSATTTAYLNYGSSDFLHLDQLVFQDPHRGPIKTIQLFYDTILIASSKKSFTMLISSGRILDTLYMGRTTCAYQQNGAYYIGTLNGLYRIIPGKSREFLGDVDPLFKCQMSQIAEGADGTLWIATYERGVIGYKGKRIIAHIRQSDGLTSDICRCLFIDRNILWVGTDKGLNQIDISRAKPVIVGKFRETDGLASDIINTVCAADSILYVGTPLGMTVFNEARIPRHAICNIRMTEVQVSGSEKDPLTDQLILSHDDNNIRFEFSVISFLAGGHFTLQYRLLGLNNKWQYSKETILSYPSLPSGAYTLQILAINKFGDKSNLLEYRFEIQQTIWERWWFRALAILAIVVLTTLIVRMLIKRAHLKEKEKLLTTQKLMELEQMALRAQMNPHFIFNCLNSMQQYIVNQDVKNANFYLSRFAGLVRQTLDNSSKIYIPVSEEIAYLKNYLELERLQLSGAFEFTITADQDIDQTKILVPNMVLQPYVENAIKHGMSQVSGEGIIAIFFRLHEEARVLECIIKDNGPGIRYMNEIKDSRSKKHISHGMSITEKRIKTINQLNSDIKDIFVTVEDIKTTDISAQGTMVTIRFPI